MRKKGQSFEVKTPKCSVLKYINSQSKLTCLCPNSMLLLSLTRWITKTHHIYSWPGCFVKFYNPLWSTIQKVSPPLL